jgi:catechol 2,3-dioxygenase-like lactoylglutathione lyase family enzyme
MRLAPMLLAHDMQETISFYTDVLGFELTDTMDDPISWCALKSGDAELMFVWEGPPHEHAPGEEHDHTLGIPGVLYFWSDDVKALHDSVVGKWRLCEELSVREHGMLEFAVIDPNGYRLRFGSNVP